MAEPVRVVVSVPASLYRACLRHLPADTQMSALLLVLLRLWLRRAHAPARPPRARHHEPLEGEWAAEAIRLYGQRLSLQAVGTQLGVHRFRVRATLVEAGLPVRRGGRPRKQ